MRSKVWIPFATWSSWTPQERAAVSLYYEDYSIPWGIDFSDVRLASYNRDLEKDHDEYIEDMSLGGKTYEP